MYIVYCTSIPISVAPYTPPRLNPQKKYVEMFFLNIEI